MAFDPADGSLQWQAPWAVVLGRRADHLLAGASLSSNTNADVGPLMIGDGRTGRVGKRVGTWTWRWAMDAPRVPLARPAEAGGWALGILDVSRQVVFPLAGIARSNVGGDGGAECSVAGPYLACVTGAGRATVWRYDRRAA